jgi:subtilisin-like proprotein convertase family protein
MKIRILLVCVLAVLLAQCNRESTQEVQVISTTTSSTVALTGSDPTNIPDLPIGFRHGVPDEMDLPVDGINVNSITFQNLPTWLTFNPSTNKLSGTAPNQSTTVNLQYSGLTIDGSVVARSFTFQTLTDPLFTYQWYLLNTGQANFAANGGTAGADLKATQVFQMSRFGQGVRIAVSDNGAQLTHEDLANNVLVGESRNYTLPPPYSGPPAVTDGHATAVAGVIAAVGWNKIGARGVAPRAKFANFNYVDSDQTSDMALNQLEGPFDIFNQSYGVNTHKEIALDPLYREKLKWGVTTLRNGKGALYVKAAGNSFNLCQGYLCSQNASADPYNSNPFTIVVGAMNAGDRKSSYSTAGSALWISTYGGEYGDTAPAVMTTDIQGCSDGYSVTGATTNTFENNHPQNMNCNYTSRFNGTSSSTPMASGAIALILEANPQLGWRDVKRILADTARQVDSNFGNTTVSASGVPFEPGWSTNAAGYKFHNWYGFGALNVKAAVDRALTYTAYLPALQESRSSFDTVWPLSAPSLNLDIPDKNSTGVSSSINIVQNWVIEAIEVKLNITHPYPADLAIRLQSPAGTQNLILNPLNSFTQKDDLVGYVILTNAFYRESSAGQWTITVMDALEEDVGKLVDWSINIIGHPN